MMETGSSSRPKVVAIIPARGGSKGIPRKNLQQVGGVSLVGRTICAARAAKLDRVIVSTDSDEIASASRMYGAEVVKRPAGIAGDFASSEAAILHVLETVFSDAMPDIVVFLQCTSPFTTAADIDGVVQKLQEQGADSCFTAASSHGFLWKIGADAEAVGINHDGRVRPMRQQRESEFLETGAVYAMRAQGFLAHRFRFFGKTIIFETEALRTLEIDSPDDLFLARRVASKFDAVNIPTRECATAAADIKVIAMDFDGVFTDDRVLVRQDGVESVLCSRSDGYGLSMLVERGLRMVVFSREANPVVAARCKKLGIEMHQAICDKLSALHQWCDQNSVSLRSVAYVGNDVPDIACLREAGLAIVPSNAHPAAQASAHVVLETAGGAGALREVAALFGVA